MTSPSTAPSDRPTVQALIDAWTQSAEAVQRLVAPLPEPDWNRAVECPGWSVRDIVSHVIGVELELLGDPRPIHTLPRDLRHVVDESSRYTEVPVDVRRCHTAPEMTAELESVLIRRGRALRGLADEDPDREVVALMGRKTRLAELLRLRVLDVWVHEQDVRRALRAPGGLDSDAGRISRDVLLGRLPDVASRAGAPAGSTVLLDVSGPVAFLRTVEVDGDGRAAVREHVPAAADAVLRTDWESYARLACGRIGPRAAGVAVEGDAALAGRFLEHFAVTP